MKKIISIAICCFILFTCVVPARAFGGVPQEVMEATKSVVRILAEYHDGSATGSGFVIKNDGTEVLIATNNHVVEDDPNSIRIWVGEDRQVDAEVVFTTSAKDLCVLRITEPVDMAPLTLSEEDAQHGSAIYAVGYPGASDVLSDTEAHTSESVTITDGIISSIRSFTIEEGEAPVKLLLMNAAINHGNSGGPLFNTKGEVIGINTYGVTGGDAQGVFGSVDISELWKLLDEYGIVLVEEVPETEPLPTEPPVPEKKPLPIAGIAAGAVFAVLALILVMLNGKKNKKVTLRAYMRRFPQGMAVNEAVSMLFPAAIALRNLHNDGKLHLQISPDTILVSAKGAALKEPSKKEMDRHSSGFAAPEVYRGAGYGVASDLYSFAAVLLFAVTGKMPVNSLQQESLGEEIALLEETEPAFAEVIRKAMAFLPQDRTQSVQELIYGISAFHDQQFRMAKPVKEKVSKEKIQKKPKERKQQAKIKAAPIVAVLAVAVIAVGLLWKPVVQPKIDAKKEAERLEAAYLSAVSLMEEGSYEEAMAAFAQLTGYQDSDARNEECRIAMENAVLEEKYQEAEALAAEGKHAHAGIAFAKLGEYKDSRERSFEEWSYVRPNQTVDTFDWYTPSIIAIKEDGTVLLTSNHKSVSEWTEIVSVYIDGLGYGIKADGSVVYAEDDDPNRKHFYAELETWTDIIQLRDTFYGLLGLKQDGTVEYACWAAPHINTDAVGAAISQWVDIVDLPMDDQAVALKADGTLVSVDAGLYYGGFYPHFSQFTEAWDNLISFDSTGFNGSSVGLRTDGSIYLYYHFIDYNEEKGEQEYIEYQETIEGYTDTIAVCSIGRYGCAALKSDGTVSIISPDTRNRDIVEEKFSDVVKDWEDITALFCCGSTLYGLKEDGTVVAAGHNDNGSMNVSDWTDIAHIVTGGCTLGIKKDGSIVIAQYVDSEAEKWTDIKLPE